MAQQMMQNMPYMGEQREQPGMLTDETGYAMPAEMAVYPQGEWTAPSGGGMPGEMGRPVTWQGGGGMSPAHAQSQRMKNPVDPENTHFPADNRQAYMASLRSLLNRNVGYYIVCTFLVGSDRAVTWQGILHTVGSDYLVLYQPDYNRYISCDLYGLKFAQFHDTRNTPHCAGFQSWQGQTGL